MIADTKYCPRCGYELLDPDSHYRDPGSYALYCLLGAQSPHERYTAVAHAMQAEMLAGDISPVIWEARMAQAAREELARTGQREVMS